jgi:hypothetical protein
MKRLAFALPVVVASACTDSPDVELSFVTRDGSITACSKELYAVREDIYVSGGERFVVRATLIHCQDAVDFVTPDYALQEYCYAAATPSTTWNDCSIEEYLDVPCEPSAYPSYRTLGSAVCVPVDAFGASDTLTLALTVATDP